MDCATQQEIKDTFATFVRWDRKRKRLKYLQWYAPLVFIFFVAYPLILIYVLPSAGVSIWQILLIVGLAVPSSIFNYYFYRRLTKRILSRLSQEACFYAAAITAENLEKGNMLEASLSMDRLLFALSDFLRRKSLSLGFGSVAPIDIMHVTPATIPRKAVLRAIQTRGDSKDFQEKLHDLVTGLRGNPDTGNVAINKFLVWLDQETKDYQKGSQTFEDKHPTLVRVIGPAVLVPIGLVIIEFVRWLLVAD